MPSISAITSAIAELPKGPPVVAVLPGGTTGIGAYIAEALATTYGREHGAKLRGYIVGRRRDRGEEVIAKCRIASPDSDWRFVQVADLALLADVDKACAEIVEQETAAPLAGGPARVDLLYMTHCYPILKERSTTKEGLDAFLSTVYYSRIRFITQLLPLLTASPRAGHVVSIYGGGMDHTNVKPGKHLIGCPPDAEYGINGVREYASFMKNFVFEELAARHAGRLSLSHVYPGLVDGPGFENPELPVWFRLVLRLVIKPLMFWYMTAPADCGKVMVYVGTDHFPAKGQKVPEGVQPVLGTDGEVGSGAYALGQRADLMSKKNEALYVPVREKDVSKKCWDHTMETLERIEKENARTAA